MLAVHLGLVFPGIRLQIRIIVDKMTAGLNYNHRGGSRVVLLVGYVWRQKTPEGCSSVTVPCGIREHDGQTWVGSYDNDGLVLTSSLDLPLQTPYVVIIAGHYTVTHVTNKSVFSFLRQLTTWHCSQLLLNAGHAAIDRYLLPDRRTDLESLYRSCRILCEQYQKD